MSYKLIKKYFLNGLFSETDLDLFVQAGWVTEEQKKELISSK